MNGAINMSIFRVEKNSNYTVISNYHLRDKNLSLKTIGLLSLILSLPEDWDYTQAGLAAITRDGEDSIRSGLKELEKYGYLERERERDENGRMRGTIYRIYEVPKNKKDEFAANGIVHDKSSKSGRKSAPKAVPVPEQTSPKQDEPKLDEPTWENPTLDIPTQELPTQDNHGQINKDLAINDEFITDESNIHHSIYPDGPMDRMSDEYREAFRAVIKENVGYELFENKIQSLDEQLERGVIDIYDYEMSSLTYNLKTVNQVIDYMLDVLTSLNNDPIKICDELISRNMVKAKLNKINFLKMKGVVYELNRNQTIKNPKKYAISMLYNAV